MDLLDDWYTLYLYTSDFKLWCICQPDRPTCFEIAALHEMAKQLGENILSRQGPDWEAVPRERGPDLLPWVPGDVVLGQARIDWISSRLSSLIPVGMQSSESPAQGLAQDEP